MAYNETIPKPFTQALVFIFPSKGYLMDFSTLTDEDLFTKFKENGQTISTGFGEVLGVSKDELPSIDVNEIVTSLHDMTLEQFMATFAATKDELIRTLDIYTIMAQIAVENFEIVKELLKRI